MSYEELLLVYRLETEDYLKSIDFHRKVVKHPKAKCRLGELTFDHFGLKPKMVEFIKSWKGKVRLLHIDELRSQYPGLKDIKAPAVLGRDDGGFDVLLNNKEIRSVSSLKELLEKIEERLDS